MFHVPLSLFSKTKSLENEIDNFHDKLIEASMIFKKSIQTYLSEGFSEHFKTASCDIKKTEHNADILRRSIENKLYSQNLIPGLRADVLQLTENLDRVINKFDEVTYMFYVEQPSIPSEYHKAIKELCKLSSDCAENMGKASRAFFRDLSSVRDYSQKVYFIEHESDGCSRNLLENIFAADMPLVNKLQLKQFIVEIADIADLAEDFIDELLIFAIKRDI
ncbi:MAG: DUF47 family protein [Alphaproteobacteria bacterium]|nr:DUF47 family protein [Alphaproteobacteria bacterium]